MKKSYQSMIAKWLIALSILTWIFERLTTVPSAIIGKLICGDSYMQAVDGKVGDMSCGFNTDMYLSFSLVIFLVLGVILTVSSKKQATWEETH